MQCSRKPWCTKRDKHVGACYPFHDPGEHMAEVIDLYKREAGYDGMVCPCGEAWFEVRAIVLSKDGSPTGYAGVPKCVACGREAGA